MGFLRGMFSGIDSVIYNLLGSIYELLMKISNIEIFNEGTLRLFSERVYALLGIFMAFKLIFSFISYVVNPDSLTEAKTGGKKLIINIVVALVLLIAVPSVIFPLARKLQTTILNEGILQQIILGVDNNSYQETMNTRNASRNVSFSVLNSFIYPSNTICSEDEAGFYRDKEVTNENDHTAMDEANDKKGDYPYKLDGKCATKINDAAGEDAEAMVLLYERAYNQKSVRNLLDNKLLKTKNDKDEFIFNYSFLVSTVAGIAVAYLLFNFCFSIAVRTIKLGFLELIAPIPILSYIDSAAKKKSFDGWLKSCIGTYMDLFVRLIAIYFAVFIISSVTKPNALHYASSINGETITVGPLVVFFIIIGALMFASQVPKLIEEVFGIKIDGKFSLNPLKSSPLASGLITGAAGGLVGGIGGAVAGFKAGGEAGARGRGILFGTLSGMGIGAKTKIGKGSLNKSMDGTYKNFSGKEYSHMSPSRAILGVGGEKKVDKIKVPLKKARELLNAKQSDLNVASHNSSSIATRLSSRGVDSSNLVKGKSEQSAIQAGLMPTSEYERLKKIREVAQKVVQQGPQGEDDKRFKAMQAQMNYIDNQTKFSEYQETVDNISDIDKLSETIEKENVLRNEIGKINKDIDTMANQKKQVQTFYGVDESPQEEYTKAAAPYLENPGSGNS